MTAVSRREMKQYRVRALGIAPNGAMRIRHEPITLRIAVADDEGDMRNYYQKVLSRLGHQVVVAENGRALVDACKANHPDLVITDIRMPELDGIDAATELVPRAARPSCSRTLTGRKAVYPDNTCPCLPFRFLDYRRKSPNRTRLFRSGGYWWRAESRLFFPCFRFCYNFPQTCSKAVRTLSQPFRPFPGPSELAASFITGMSSRQGP